MQQFNTPTKARKWAKASKALLLQQADLLGYSSANMGRLAEKTWGNISFEDIDFIMACFNELFKVAVLNEADPRCQLTMKILRKIVVSYQHGNIPRQ